jgi:hypothetical protein
MRRQMKGAGLDIAEMSLSVQVTCQLRMRGRALSTISTQLQTKTGTHLKKILAKIRLLWTTELAGTFMMMYKSRKSTHLKVSSHPTFQRNPSKSADIGCESHQRMSVISPRAKARVAALQDHKITRM